MNNIQIFKLTSGEWIIGDVKPPSTTVDGLVNIPTDNSLTLSVAMMIHVVPQGPGSYGLGLMPFNPANPDGYLKVFLDNVVAQSAPTKDLEDVYLQQRSGIELVPSLATLNGR